MPNLSIKLDEATRQRLQEVAAGQGITPHAFMIKAIGAELEQAEAKSAFVAQALAARAQVIATGQVTTFAGTTGVAGSADGIGTAHAAGFPSPS